MVAARRNAKRSGMPPAASEARLPHPEAEAAARGPAWQAPGTVLSGVRSQCVRSRFPSRPGRRTCSSSAGESAYCHGDTSAKWGVHILHIFFGLHICHILHIFCHIPYKFQYFIKLIYFAYFLHILHIFYIF